MKKNPFITGTLVALAFASSASAQVYRCGDTYSQQACPGGTLVQAEDTRSPAQRTQTSQAAQRDAKLADAMEKARLKEEAKPAQAYIPPPKVEPVAAVEENKPVMTKPKKPKYFTAVAPGTKAKAKKKKTKAKEAA